jgi:hypothetical protein
MKQKQKPTRRPKFAGVVLCSQRDGVAVYEHNLTPEEAQSEIAKLRSEGLPAFMLEQRQLHGAPDSDTCDPCRRNVARSMKDGNGKARAMVAAAKTATAASRRGAVNQ